MDSIIILGGSQIFFLILVGGIQKSDSLKSALKFYHESIDSPQTKELIMRTALLYFASFYHNDIICIFDSLESMSNHDNRAPMKQGIESLGDLFFTK